MPEPKTLIDAVRYFSDPQICHDYMVALKWPDGRIVCPKCDSERIGEIKTRRLLRCNAKGCRKQFSAKVGTIFEDSPLPLPSWFVAVWCIANAKNGISSCELARALGVTQRTAWFMLHRIRVAMRTKTFRKLSGEVESDETFIGGAAANMHAARREKKIRGRGSVGKAIVHGLLERGTPDKPSQIRTTVVPNIEAETLMSVVSRNVEFSSTVYTDAHASYAALNLRFIRQFIDHATTYVSGRIHVNGLENFWSLLKRTLRGTYVAVAPFHLFRYLDEQTYRFNARKGDDGDRFAEVMRGVIGERLLFRRLCAIGDSGFMGIP